MRKYLLPVILSLISIQSIFAQDPSSMQIYLFTPVTRTIDTVYDIGFYQDGLIKTVEMYVNQQDILHPATGLDNLNLYKSFYIERHDTKIIIFQQENAQDRTKLEELSYLQGGDFRGLTTRHSYTYTLDTNAYAEYTREDGNRYRYWIENNSIVLQYADLYKRTYQFNEGILTSIIDKGQRNDSARILTNDSKYTILWGDPLNYDSKYIFMKVSPKIPIFASGVINQSVNFLNFDLAPFSLLSVRDDNSLEFDQKVFTPAEYDSSSFLTEGTREFLPINLGISLFSIPWVEGVSGDGGGETITISREEPFTELLFSNGFQSYDNPDLYEKNSRVKTIKIIGKNTGFSMDYILNDTSSPQIIPLEQQDSAVDIVIEDVYHGTKWQDTCINYILVR